MRYDLVLLCLTSYAHLLNVETAFLIIIHVINLTAHGWRWCWMVAEWLLYYFIYSLKIRR